jgi:subtilisin family serine protease
VRVYQFRHIRADDQCSRTIFALKRGLLICGLAALGFAPAARAGTVEVVVTLKAPPLAVAFTHQRTLAFSSFLRPHRLALDTPASRSYLAGLARAQHLVQQRILASIPSARTRWHYDVVANGFAVVVPRADVGRLSRVPGVAKVWPTVTYHPLLDRTPQLIGAPSLWGPTLATAGEGMKIGIIDDGIDQTHPFFSPAGFAYPPGFPKGQTAYTTPKVIVARAFPPATHRYSGSSLPFDPDQSEHGLHVAGIAAGDNGTTTRSGIVLSGIAPRAYLGNYRAATIASDIGLNANSPELAGAVESAVRDGMDVLNISFGETEIEPSRDLVVHAIDAAAKAGVVTAVSAGNDFASFGLGSINSPANATGAIAAAASSGGHGSIEVDAPADFSSAGPAPYSLRFKPDVTAPGEDVASAAPGGGFVELSGTSMSAPHVAGAAALLLQRHPGWTPAQVKSALVLTGAPVHPDGGTEVSPLREGGGRIALVAADQPLVFAQPTSLAFGLVRTGGSRTLRVQLSDAGGGAGTWAVAVTGVLTGSVHLPRQVSVPGTLAIRVSVARATREQDASGFVVVTRGGIARRIPYWFRVEHPRLPLDGLRNLPRPGTYRGNTELGKANVSSYRYPDVPLGATSFPVRLPGRELVYRVRIRGAVANFGVAVTSLGRGARVEPRIVRGDDENRLAGVAALPVDENPYRPSDGSHRLVAGVVFPLPGVYEVVFDTPLHGHPGPFTFRFWQNDVTPPSVRLLGVRGRVLDVAVTDAGSGVDATSLTVRVDGRLTSGTYANGRVQIPLGDLGRGRHALDLSVADYQETKNMEDVPLVLPNTRVFATTFVLP